MEPLQKIRLISDPDDVGGDSLATFAAKVNANFDALSELTPSIEGALIVVHHGDDPTVPRPDADSVRWIGSVAPNNAEVGDEWIHI